MVDQGSAGDWEQVLELERRRSGLLEQAFTEALPADEPTASRIRAILETDKRLMSLGVEARDEAASELAQLQRGRKGQQAYRSAGS
jgi:hypothetical protein